MEIQRQGCKFHRYVGNSPLNFRDAFGLEEVNNLGLTQQEQNQIIGNIVYNGRQPVTEADIWRNTVNDSIMRAEEDNTYPIFSSNFGKEKNRVAGEIVFTDEAIARGNKEYSHDAIDINFTCKLNCTGIEDKIDKHKYTMYDGICSSDINIKKGDYIIFSWNRMINGRLFNVETPNISGETSSEGSIVIGKHSLSAHVGGGLSIFEVEGGNEATIFGQGAGDTDTTLLGGFKGEADVSLSYENFSLSGEYRWNILRGAVGEGDKKSFQVGLGKK